MATYEQWNDAIIQYFTNGEKIGAAIYLDTSEERLAEIGRTYLSNVGTLPSNWVDDFKSAVRSKCTRLDTNSQREVYLHRVINREPEQIDRPPAGVAFLALMALAAHNMTEDEEAADHNYFTRLRQLLAIPGHKRPPGMPAGEEERLWQEWNRWLKQKGFGITALLGEGPQKYVSYPLSQPILRIADRERLFSCFKERNYPAGLDQTRLGGRLRRDARYLGGKHLREVLADGNIQRQEAVNLALFEIYIEWLEAGRPARPSQFRLSGTNRTFSQNLFAGLYRRVEDVFSNQVNYYLYPPQPRRVRINTTPTILHQGEQIELEVERPGWYWPLSDWPLNAEQLSQGVNCKLEGIAELRELILPSRDFWLLVPDPDCPTSGEYATWQHYPELGTPFILLCKAELQSQLEQLQKDEKLTWQGAARRVNNLPGWLEFIGMQVISENWGPATIENKDLFEALRPKSSLGLALTGGLRLNERDSWLEGCGPEITLVSFNEKAYLEIHPLTVQSDPTPSQPIILHDLAELENAFYSRSSTEDKPHKIALEVETNKRLQINWPKAGEYRIEVSSGADYLEKIVTIRAWQDLQLRPIELSPAIGFEIGTARIFGPLVEKIGNV